MTEGNVAALYHCEKDKYYLYVLDGRITLSIDCFHRDHIIYEVKLGQILEDEVRVET